MNNAIIAAIFNDMADILDIMDVEWKPQAFRRAARSLESLGVDVSEIYKKKGKKGLLEINGMFLM